MKKKNLLILHGALGSVSQFEPLKNVLQNDFSVHLLNFSGHGGKSFADDFSIHQFTKDVERFLSENKIEKIDIFGYSMGGYVALNLAKNNPQSVEKIFTLGTKFHWSPEVANHEIKMLNPSKIEEKIPQFAQILNERHAPNDWKDVLHKTAQMMINLGNKNILNDNDFTQIEHKITISLGDKDNMVSIEETVNVYRKLKNARLIIMPDTQHPIEKVDLTRICNEIRTFFRE